MAREGACRSRDAELFRLLHGGGFYQDPEVLVDRPLLWVDRLGNTVQKHCRSSDVLASPSELWEIISLIHDVVLDLAGAISGAAHRVMRVGHNMLHRACRHRQRLVLPLLL